jgi:predicted membrane-bound spermidine synthase
MVASAADLLYLFLFAPEWGSSLITAAGFVFAAGAVWFYFDLRNAASNKRLERGSHWKRKETA